jgi:mRNA-degrading endonuclease RelE of RelBE toxin-antitoxin system
VDKIEKAIKKLTEKERKLIKETVKALRAGRFNNLDIKKLKGAEGIFRVKKGKVRVIYQIKGKQIFILKIGRRREDTYRF